MSWNLKQRTDEFTKLPLIKRGLHTPAPTLTCTDMHSTSQRFDWTKWGYDWRDIWWLNGSYRWPYGSYQSWWWRAVPWGHTGCRKQDRWMATLRCHLLCLLRQMYHTVWFPNVSICGSILLGALTYWVYTKNLLTNECDSQMHHRCS